MINSSIFFFPDEYVPKPAPRRSARLQASLNSGTDDSNPLHFLDADLSESTRTRHSGRSQTSSSTDKDDLYLWLKKRKRKKDDLYPGLKKQQKTKDDLYPVDMLESARSKLENLVHNKCSTQWNMLKVKCGIHPDGRKDCSHEGWGLASIIFSFSGLPVEYLHEFTVGGVDFSSDYLHRKRHKVSNSVPTATITNENMLDKSVVEESDMGNGVPNLDVGAVNEMSSAASQLEENSSVNVSRDGVTTDQNKTPQHDLGIESLFVLEKNISNKDKTDAEKSNPDSCTKPTVITDKVVAVPGEVDLLKNNNSGDMNIDSLFLIDRNLSGTHRNHTEKTDKQAYATDETVELKKHNVVVGLAEESDKELDHNGQPQQSGSSAYISAKEGNIFKKKYLCDLCPAIFAHGDTMLEHLQEAMHYSASLVTVDENEAPKHTLQQCCLAWPPASYKTLIPICPYSHCFCIFLHIFACATHYNFCHDEQAGAEYALAELVREDVIKSHHIHEACKVCSKTFPGTRELTEHMKMTGHLPYTTEKDTETMFLCCRCKHTFANFFRALAHCGMKKKMHFSDLRVLHISLTRTKKKILPFQQTELAEKATLDSEVLNLKYLKSQMGKAGRKKINKRIRELQGLKPKNKMKNKGRVSKQDKGLEQKNKTKNKGRFSKHHNTDNAYQKFLKKLSYSVKH